MTYDRCYACKYKQHYDKEGLAAHICFLMTAYVYNSNEKESDFAGPPWDIHTSLRYAHWDDYVTE